MNKTIIATKNRLITRSALFAGALMFVLPFAAHAAFISQQLDLGMTNSDVTSLQTFLAQNSAIYPEGIVSGFYGPLTAAAVSRFQVENNLPSVGRVGPATLALINSQMGGTISNGADISAPTIFPETVTVSSNSATISWTTSEASRGRVMFGSTWPFLYSTAPSVSTASFGSTSSVTLTGLQAHTTYFYVLESVDAAGNIQWTVGKPLTTTN